MASYITPNGSTVGSQATGTTATNKTVATSTSAAEVMTASTTRKYLRFTNNDATITIYIGDSNLVTGASANAHGGIALKALDSYVVPPEYAGQSWWAVSVSSTPVLGILSGT